jgi:hypothetical protein
MNTRSSILTRPVSSALTRGPSSALGLAGACAVLFAGPARAAALAQEEPTAHVVVPDVAPRAEDVGTLDGIIEAFYDVISGPAGQPRDWARDRTLYLPGAIFVPTGMREGESKPYFYVMDHQAFVDRVDAEMVREGFFEREIHRVTRKFGNIAHVFSTYEARRTPEGPVIARGVNSIELFHDGGRWWIAFAMWDEERPGNPIPKEFLP